MPKLFNVTFVCMGNICRSPTAHGVFRSKLRDAGLERWVGVDSAGTHSFHHGAPPDRRSQAHAARRGYDLSKLRARQLTASDFERADLILVMDGDNLTVAADRCRPEQRHKLQRLAAFCSVHAVTDVPDPYYGGVEEFERVIDVIEDACEGLLGHVERELAARRAAR